MALTPSEKFQLVAALSTTLLTPNLEAATLTPERPGLASRPGQVGVPPQTPPPFALPVPPYIEIGQTPRDRLSEERIKELERQTNRAPFLLPMPLELKDPFSELPTYAQVKKAFFDIRDFVKAGAKVPDEYLQLFAQVRAQASCASASSVANPSPSSPEDLVGPDFIERNPMRMLARVEDGELVKRIETLTADYIESRRHEKAARPNVYVLRYNCAYPIYDEVSIQYRLSYAMFFGGFRGHGIPTSGNGLLPESLASDLTRSYVALSELPDLQVSVAKEFKERLSREAFHQVVTRAHSPGLNTVNFPVEKHFPEQGRIYYEDPWQLVERYGAALPGANVTLGVAPSMIPTAAPATTALPPATATVSTPHVGFSWRGSARKEQAPIDKWYEIKFIPSDPPPAAPAEKK